MHERRGTTVHMRACAVLVAVAVLGAPAFAGPKSSLPPQVAKVARDAFAAGRVADEKGDLQGALDEYKRAYEIAPHPFVLFNMADIYRRMKNYKDAIATFEKYLASEDVPDRTSVEKILAELRAIPGTLVIEMKEPDGIVFVDGKRLGRVGTYDVTPGTHVVDVITPITHGYEICTATAGRENTCRVHAKPREDGNVVLSGRWPMGGRSWSTTHASGEKVRFEFRGRAIAKAGHYSDLKVMESQCAPMPLDVPDGDVVIFGYVDYPDRAKTKKTCYDTTLTVQRVKF